MNTSYLPQRIVCLTEETTETLYLLGKEDRIVGISGFTTRPPVAKKEKPVVSTFIDAQVAEIVRLEPDLVIGFSDIQASIAQQLIARGITVWVNNYRTVEGIYSMIIQLGTLTGKQAAAAHLVDGYKNRLLDIQRQAATYTLRPKVYFEEWYEPLIPGICWVSELIETAGGIDIFAEGREQPLAKDRIIADADEIIRRNPDIILASWCGKKFKKEKLLARPGWQEINAVKTGHIFEIKSDIILQPGPAALTDGIDAIACYITAWQKKTFAQ